jgi:hypothetical protein
MFDLPFISFKDFLEISWILGSIVLIFSFVIFFPQFFYKEVSKLLSSLSNKFKKNILSKFIIINLVSLFLFIFIIVFYWSFYFLYNFTVPPLDIIANHSFILIFILSILLFSIFANDEFMSALKI